MRGPASATRSSGKSGTTWRATVSTTSCAEAEVQQEIADNLTLFIEELATHHHALAQSGEDIGNCRRAADYYQLYIDSFPADERVPNGLPADGDPHRVRRPRACRGDVRMGGLRLSGL